MSILRRSGTLSSPWVSKKWLGLSGSHPQTSLSALNTFLDSLVKYFLEDTVRNSVLIFVQFSFLFTSLPIHVSERISVANQSQHINSIGLCRKPWSVTGMHVSQEYQWCLYHPQQREGKIHSVAERCSDCFRNSPHPSFRVHTV